MKVLDREEKIIEGICVALCKLEGQDPYERMLRVEGSGSGLATKIHDVTTVPRWHEYREAAIRFRVAILAMQVAERENPESDTELPMTFDDELIKLVVGTEDEKRDALAAIQRHGEYRYVPNNNQDRPTYGQPFTCGCGRLSGDLTALTRFCAVNVKTGHRHIYCEFCVSLSDFVGQGYARLTEKPGGQLLLRTLYGAARYAPKAEPAAEPAGDPVKPEPDKTPAQENPETRRLETLPHVADWQMRAGREQCRVCAYWRYSPEAEALHKESIPVETEQNSPEKQDA